jgi:hypothetical protein
MKVAIEPISQTEKYHKIPVRLELWAAAGDLNRPYKSYDERIREI